MSESVETMEVEDPDNHREKMIINASDFDPAVHTPWPGDMPDDDDAADEEPKEPAGA